MKEEKESGITLIALVVTVILLLILSGVILSMVLGNSGLFSRAKYAVDKYEGESNREKNLLDELEIQAEIASGAETYTIQYNANGGRSKPDNQTQLSRKNYNFK